MLVDQDDRSPCAVLLVLDCALVPCLIRTFSQSSRFLRQAQATGWPPAGKGAYMLPPQIRLRIIVESLIRIKHTSK